MKKTEQVVGLPVVDVSSGNQVGTVWGLVINPDGGRVGYLLIERDKWYGEIRAILYDAIAGIGEFAVTVASREDIIYSGSKPDLISLLDGGVKVLDSGVMTRSGEFVGTVKEFYFDESSGKITRCEVEQDNGETAVLAAEKVIAYGARYMVIEGKYDQPKPAKGNVQSDDPVEMFESKQRQYLVGKKTSKKITGTGGLVIVEQGEVVTEEVIMKAQAMDKYIELTMNVTS